MLKDRVKDVYYTNYELPWWCKEFACQPMQETQVQSLGWENLDHSGNRNGNPLYSMDSGDWQSVVPEVAKESDTT